jgi:hypothetical protein
MEACEGYKNLIKEKIVPFLYVAVLPLSAYLHMHNGLIPCSYVEKKAFPTHRWLQKTSQNQKATQKTNNLVAAAKQFHLHKRRNKQKKCDP